MVEDSRVEVVFVLGFVGRLVSNGHDRNALEIISRCSRYKNCIVFCDYKDSSFLHELPNLDKKIFNLKRSKKWRNIILALISFRPVGVLRYINEENIDLINKKIVDLNVKNLHCIYFPSTALMGSKLNCKAKFMTLPDLYSKYYYQIWTKSPFSILYLYNCLAYWLLEFHLKNVYDKVYFVNFDESKSSWFDNTKHIPLFQSQKIINNVSNNEVLLSRSNEKNTIWFVKNVVIKLEDVKFTILSSSLVVRKLVNSLGLENLVLLDWIDDYDQFSSNYFIHICIDHVGTGMSTKVLNLLRTRSVIIGTDLSYRGFSDLPKDIRLTYISGLDLVSRIQEALLLSDIDLENYFELKRKYVDLYLNGTKNLNIILNNYKVD